LKGGNSRSRDDREARYLIAHMLNDGPTWAFNPNTRRGMQLKQTQVYVASSSNTIMLGLQPQHHAGNAVETDTGIRSILEQHNYHCSKTMELCHVLRIHCTVQCCVMPSVWCHVISVVVEFRVSEGEELGSEQRTTTLWSKSGPSPHNHTVCTAAVGLGKIHCEVCRGEQG
jgi:hypothetical protein